MGKITKTFQSGEVLKAADLNVLVDGINSNSDAVETVSELVAVISPKVEEISGLGISITDDGVLTIGGKKYQLTPYVEAPNYVYGYAVITEGNTYDSAEAMTEKLQSVLGDATTTEADAVEAGQQFGVSIPDSGIVFMLVKDGVSTEIGYRDGTNTLQQFVSGKAQLNAASVTFAGKGYKAFAIKKTSAEAVTLEIL